MSKHIRFPYPHRRRPISLPNNPYYLPLVGFVILVSAKTKRKRYT